MYIQHEGENLYFGTARRDIDPSKPTIVFVHGAGMDHSVWLFYSRYFARQGYNVLAVDLPGHGRSTGEPLPTIEAMAACLDGVIGALEIERISIVGHSMGALVAFEFAASFPQRCERAVLLGFAYPMAVGPPLLDAARNNDASAIDMMVIFGHDFQTQLGGNRAAGMYVVNGARALLARNRPGVLFNDLNACNEYSNEGAAGAISCPVVLASGANDKMTPPRAAQTMADQLSAGRYASIDDSGHGVMAEQPELTQRVLSAAMLS